MSFFSRWRVDQVAPSAAASTIPADGAIPAARPAAIIAASQRMLPDIYRNLRIPTEQWQTEAWRQYDMNGELAFGCRWLGAALSRCRLIVADVSPTGQILKETEDVDIQKILANFMGGPGRQAEMLQNMGTHMTVPGDAYIVAPIDTETNQFVSWTVYSQEEVKSGMPGFFTVNTGDGFPKVYSLANTLLIRVYRPHPRKSYEADSAARTALPVLREMEQLTKYLFAVIDSRLATAGILGVPSGLEFPNPGDDIQPGESPLMAYLAKVMIASIKDRGSAAAVVPITLQGPGEALDQIRWITPPNAELTNVVAELREKCIRRLALNLDMPPEVLLGVADSNHWGSWAVEEQSIKLHIEPLMALICSAITERFLWPSLIASGLTRDEAKAYAVWFDPSGLVLRPNRSTDAKDVYDRGQLSAKALREATGFTEQDAPQDEEACLRGLEMILKASPQMGDLIVGSLVKILGLEKCGIVLEDLGRAVPPDPEGGTPPNESVNRAPDANKDPTAPPDPNGNGGENEDGV